MGPVASPGAFKGAASRVPVPVPEAGAAPGGRAGTGGAASGARVSAAGPRRRLVCPQPQPQPRGEASPRFTAQTLSPAALGACPAARGALRARQGNGSQLTAPRRDPRLPRSKK